MVLVTPCCTMVTLLLLKLFEFAKNFEFHKPTKVFIIPMRYMIVTQHPSR